MNLADTADAIVRDLAATDPPISVSRAVCYLCDAEIPMTATQPP